jgi:hypothetical protein
MVITFTPAVPARVLGHTDAAVAQVALPPAVVELLRLFAAAGGNDESGTKDDADLAGDVALGDGGRERVAAHAGSVGSSA